MSELSPVGWFQEDTCLLSSTEREAPMGQLVTCKQRLDQQLQIVDLIPIESARCCSLIRRDEEKRHYAGVQRRSCCCWF